MFESEISRSKKVILFTLLIALNIALRIPSIPHEKGSDSFFMHTLANSLTGFGHANWWLHWLSVFGYYPYSYASAVPFSLSGISQLTGIEMEHTILLYCIILGLFSIFSSYLLAGLFYDDFLFKYLMAFFYSISPSTMYFTTWEISSRGPVNMFLPLFLYLLIKHARNIKGVFLLLFTWIYLLSTHHIAIITVPAVLLFIVIKLISKTIITKNKFLSTNFTNYIYAAILLVSILLPFFNSSGTGIIGSRYGWIISSIIIAIRYIGPMIAFSFSGLVYLTFKKDKRIVHWYILCCFIFIAPFMYNLTYGIHIAQLFLIVLLAIAFRNVLNLKAISSSRLIRVFFITIVLSSVIYSSFYNHYRTGQYKESWYMEDRTHKTAEWIDHNIKKENRILFVSQGYERVRSAAFQQNGSSIIIGGTEGLAYGFIDKDLIKNLEKVPMTDSYFYFEGAYKLNERIDQFDDYDWYLATRRIDIIKKAYDFRYLVQSMQYTTPIGFYETDKKEKVYSDGTLEVYDLRSM